ncbi:MAG: sulfotransferase, partial [Proteobacteria bacterium]|nr:sulfotransferase [Pseudomonadota bacterium]
MLYLDQDDPQQALHYFEDAVRLDGSQASAYLGLAQTFRRLGKDKQADAARQQYLQLSPVAQALVEANDLVVNGEMENAEQICERVLKEHPTNTDVLRLLARIASEDGRYVVAEGLLKRIIKLAGDYYQPYSDLGRFLGERGRIPEAVEMLEKAVALDGTVVATQQSRGDFLAILGKSGDALQAYDAVLQLNPDYPPAVSGRGHMLRILGRQEEAIAAYETCTSTRPEFGDAWWSLASLKAYRFSADQIDAMRAQLDSTTVDKNSRISFYFAMARACEDRNDFDKAWQNYVLGNSLKRAQIQYDPVQSEMSHDSILKIFERNFLNSIDIPESGGPTPIFILGMPRSGSTLLEQILASHSLVEGSGELPYIVMMSDALGGRNADGKKYPEVLTDMSADQLASLGKSYLYHSKTNRPENLPCFTDKMPANFAHVGLIHLTLPNAKIIDARRHPLDTCVANFRQLYAQGKNQAYDLNEFAEYFLDYVRVMHHWDAVLPGRVLKVQYEDVVADLEGQTRRMLEYCELPWEDECLSFHQSSRPVNTASADQVRQPIYSDSVAYWKNYESHLADVKEILAPVL